MFYRNQSKVILTWILNNLLDFRILAQAILKESISEKIKKMWMGVGVGRVLVRCFGFSGPLRQYLSLYQAVSQREGERGEKRIDESKNVQTTLTCTYYKRSRPLSYYHQNCRTPRHWKFIQHLHTTRPPRMGRGGVEVKYKTATIYTM